VGDALVSDAPAPTPAPASASAPSEPPSDKAGKARWARSPHLWVSSTYFAEGFPYAVVNNLAEILFKQLGASLEVVGLTSLFHLPWNFKFLWGPLVDNYETKRRWLLGTEAVILAVLVLLGLLAAGQGVALVPLALGFLLLGLLSATHDIAIDGFYMEVLAGPDQSKFVGYRAAAYRIAVLVVGGPLLALIAWLGWALGLGLTAVVMALILAYHSYALPRTEPGKRPWTSLGRSLLSWRVLPLWLMAAALLAVEHYWAGFTALGWQIQALTGRAAWLAKLGVGGWTAATLGVLLVLAIPIVRWRVRVRAGGPRSAYAESFSSFLAQPKVGVMLAFVVLFRTGESFLQKMRWPFFDDVVQLPLELYGIANGTIGVLASFVATIVGGRLIARDGLRRWIWPFVLAQNVLNLLYMGLALLPDPSAIGPITLTTIIAAEHAGAGLGTAVFMVYLMRTCDPAHKAGHFAIVSALMSLSFTIAGVSSGFLAAEIGFANYFGFTFLATLPGMALIFFIPHLDGRESSRA
jgi:MFS transporter, PAT family, beta-lactamase induction signal transducer AmpG